MYSCFTEKGEDVLPNESFITDCYKQGIEPVIFLDSCVCLHIIKVVDYGKSAKNVNFERILALKEYLEKHPQIRINPFFAFLELCNQKGVLDKQKLHDLKLRIDFFEQIPLKVFKKFKYDFHRDILVIRNFYNLNEKSLEAINPILKNCYCALLKIRSIALKGLTKNKAENNLNEFLHWMINDLEIIRGAEYKLAMNIFGGDTAFRKMIGLDSSPKDAQKKLIGTSWDMFHSKFTANSFRLFEILERNIYPFFLTSDANLFRIFQNFSLEVIKDGDNSYVTSFVLTADSLSPHFDDSFIEKNNEKLINLFLERRNHKYIFDEIKVNELIKELENENKIIS